MTNVKASMALTLIASRRLDLHLTQSIETLKGDDSMSKYSETADRFRKMREAHADRLRTLNTRMDAHESTSDGVFRSYEGAIEDQEAGMREMEEEIRDMQNSLKGGETGDTVSKFPGADGQTKTGTG